MKLGDKFENLSIKFDFLYVNKRQFNNYTVLLYNFMEFKEYLLTENKQYFADKVNDVLTSLHELIQGGKQISARQLILRSEEIVNQIRRILHTSWQRSFLKHLRVLQKCGVAIMLAIDEKGDLDDTLNSCRAEVEDLLGKLGKPVNSLGTPKAIKEKEPDYGSQQQQEPDSSPNVGGVPEM